jgi:hypothetical protein
MVLEALQLAEQNRAWSTTVDRALDTELVLHVGKAMHETQKERGMTAIHLGSGGRDLAFELGQQHIAADKAIGAMADALSRHIALHPIDADRGGSDTAEGERETDEVIATSAGPLGLTREKRSFSNAVDAALAFVAELPARRKAYVKSSSMGTLLTSQEMVTTLPNTPEPGHLAAAAAASAGDHFVSGDSHSDSDGYRQSSMALRHAIAFYTQMHHTLITLATELCTDFMTGVAPGIINDLAPALFAYINLMVIKEKAGIERGGCCSV